ncbi:MAG: hypothetical protein Q7S82_02560, partial [bacterium]|nr:hypothetical protein [bacterium]
MPRVFKIYLPSSAKRSEGLRRERSSLRLKFFLIGFLVFFVFAFYVFQIFFAKASNNEIKIIPGFYSGDPSTGDWQNPQAVFSQDLNESTGIEEFNAENSAHPFASLAETEPAVDVGHLQIEIEQEPPANQPEIIPEEITTSTEEIPTSTGEAGTSTEEITPPETASITEEIAPTSGTSTEIEEAQPSSFWNKPFYFLKNTFAEFLKNAIQKGKDAVLAIKNFFIAFAEEIQQDKPVEEDSFFSTSSEASVIEEIATSTGEIATSIEEDSFFSTSTEASVTEELPIEVAAEIKEQSSVLILSDFSVPEESSKDKIIKNVQLRLSLAGKGEAGDRLIIDYSFQPCPPEEQNNFCGDWQNLGEFNLEDEISNALNGGYFLFALPIFENWDDLNNLKVRFTYVGQQVTGDKRQEVYLDAVWLEVEIGEDPAKEYSLEMLSDKKDFKVDEAPAFEFKYQKKRNFVQSMEANLLSVVRDEYKDVEINVFVPGLDISPIVDYKRNGEFSVEMEKPREIRPGKHLLNIEIKDNGKIYTQQQEFTWGVLAVNTNKSIYLSDEKAYLQMAALQDNGHTLCDANLILQVKNPQFQVQTFSTADGTIQKSGQCSGDNVTDMPDYFSYYQTGSAGFYKMTLILMADDGQTELRRIDDSFEVWNSVPFDVERIGPTRIYPLSAYEMQFKIKANQDFSGEVKERLPSSFAITNAGNSREEINGEEKTIIWQVDWKAGETYELKFTFDAPDISPYLYLLGPLQSLDISDFNFQEIRQWQVAADANTSEKNPGTITETTYAASGTVAWVAPQNASSSADNTYATSSITDWQWTKYIMATNFGFTSGDIPASSTINGIVVSVEKSANNISRILDGSVMLVKQGTTTGSDLRDGTNYWGTSDASTTYGSATNTWGVSWTDEDFTATDTSGVAFSAYKGSSAGTTFITFIDAIWITVYYTAPVVNSAPTWNAVYESDPGSATTTPTNVGSVVTFESRATDAGSNIYYLFCKATTAPATSTTGGWPTCDGSGTWATSSAASAASTTATYTTLVGDAENNAWYAFACDDDSTNQLCTAVSQGTGAIDAMYSPFATNHAPSLTAVNSSGNLDPGATVTIYASSTDADSASVDTVTMYACKAADGTSSGCGGGGEWCNATSTADPTCNYSVPTPTADAAYTYYVYVFDNHSFASSPATLNSTFSVNNVAPVVSQVKLNNDSAISLTENATTSVPMQATVSDNNGCSDVSTAIATVYRQASSTSCTAQDDNFCY